jgi:hypothetical protein
VSRQVFNVLPVIRCDPFVILRRLGIVRATLPMDRSKGGTRRVTEAIIACLGHDQQA